MGSEEKLGRLDRLCLFLSHYRLAVLIGILVITAIFLYGALHIRGEVILQDLLPYDHPYLKLHNRFSKVFGSGGSTVAIALKAQKGDIFNYSFLKKFQNMTNEVQMWDEVYRALTVSIATRSVKVVKALKKGEISVEPIMWPEVPLSVQEMDLLKRNIFSSPAYNGSLVSRDGTAALLLTEFKENISYERVFNLLQKLDNDYTDPNTSVHIIGFPMLMGWIYSLRTQMYVVFAISIVLMLIVLFVMFRNFLGMIAPMANALILTIWGLGFIGFTRVNFSPLLYVLAFLVGARMVSNSVQVAYRYFEELHASGNDRIRASYETMRAMFMPNFAAVATDAAGFLVLFLAKIVLMQNLAIIMSFWMMSIILTGFMVPAVCNLIPLKVASEKWAKERSQVDWQARAITKITRFALGPGSKYVVAMLIVLVMIFCSWQVSKLKIGDPTPGSPLLWPSHTYNKDQAMINKLFDASSENFLLFYEGKFESVYDPNVLLTFEAFDRHMQERLSDIYKSPDSVINTVKMVNVTLHDGDQMWFQLVRDPNLLTGLMGYVKSSTDTATMMRYIDRTLDKAQITLYFADHTSDNLLRIRDAAYDFFKNRPMKIEKGEYKLAGGRIGMEIALNEEMKRAHVIIDLTVLIAIFILCTLSFMSVTAGLMLTLPLIFANSVAFAYMALANIGLSINTLPIAAIGVGVGVDFAIYLYSRCIEEFPIQGGDWSGTIIQSVCTTGKAVLYTGLTIILPIITWYFLSDMKFQAQVGFFLAMIMGTNVILTLTLHPLLIYMIKPGFISRRKLGFAKGEAEAV
jgi:predicted RND superfamily exporter protein